MYYRADIYFKNRETRLAREDLNKIIRINPIETTAFLKLAEIYLLLEQYDVAIKNCNEVLKINVFNPQAYFIKGMSYKYAGDTVNAISSFQTTVEQDDKHYDAYIQLGNLFSTQKNPIALEYYNNAILIQPENIEGILFKSIFLQDNKNHIKALEGYDLILKLSPNHKQALFNKGYIYLVFTEEYELAKNIYNTYLKYYPNDPDAIYNLGLAYEELKQISKAIECYKEVLSIVPNHDLAARSLSRLD